MKAKGLGPEPMESTHKPSLNIRADVNSYGSPDNSEYDKRRKKELSAEIKLIEKHLNNWDNEKVGNHAKADLENQLIEKKTQLKNLSKHKLSMM